MPLQSGMAARFGGTILRGQEDNAGNPELAVHSTVMQISDYLRSIQAK